jgi:hypothetical protein
MVTGWRMSPTKRDKNEIYLTSFPEGKGKWKVSATGGAYPAWSANGREIFFNDLKDDIAVCPITLKGADVEIGTQQVLFHASMPGFGTGFDVSPDGQRLLVNLAEGEAAAPLKIITNWPSELK